MCCFYEWLPSLLSALWLSQAHWWDTSSFALILPCLSFKCFSVCQMFLCFCFCMTFSLHIKTQLVFYLLTLAAFSHLTVLFSSVVPSFCSFSFFTLGNIFHCVFAAADERAPSFFPVFLAFCPVFIPSSVHLSLCVFSLLCLKQREQWTWCQIMQISSGLIWKQQHVVLFLELLHPHLTRSCNFWATLVFVNLKLY